MTQICTPALLLTSQAEMLVSLYIGVFLAHFCSRMLTAVFKIQKKFTFDSSLCLNFYTQHQFWRGEKMNLCLWMTNCLKVGLIMAAVKEFHLYQPQYDNDNIFHGTEEWQEKRGKEPTIFISEVFPQQNQLLLLFFWRRWRCFCHTWISLWDLDRTPKTEQMKGHHSADLSRFADAYLCQDLHPLRPFSVSAMYTLVEAG